MQPFELFVGLRYTRAKRRNHFISFISLTSMLGIILGMTALITVLSVMNGFQREVRTRILSVASHVQVTGEENILHGWQSMETEVLKNPKVQAVAPFVQEQGLLSYSGVVRGAIIRGVLPGAEDKVADIGKHMKVGQFADLKPGEFGIALGVDLARTLRVTVGDKVVLIAPQGQVTPAGVVPRLKQFTVIGVFEVGHYEFDSGLAVIHLADAQKLYQLGDAVSGVRLKLNDLMDAPQVSYELSRSLNANAFITDWTRQNANYFRAIDIEKRMMFIILTLIIAVAAFNIVSALVMVVTDKQSDIAILRTLGATPASIMKIFIVQGTVIGVTGTILGLIGGVTLALNVDTVVKFIEHVFTIQILSREVYYISELPTDLQMNDVAVIAVMAFALTLLATLYPSFRASRTKPAEALRYE
ncbi:MAG: lipoprotein-releasing ABC transporter permease subunit [Pseudomonadota bacterium]